MSPDPSGNDPSRLAPPFFASEPAPPPAPPAAEPPARAGEEAAGADTGTGAGDDEAAEFPWETGSHEDELVLMDVVESPGESAVASESGTAEGATAGSEGTAQEPTPGAGETTSGAGEPASGTGDVTSIEDFMTPAAEQSAEPFPADVFYVPEDARATPAGAAPEQGIPVHDPEAVAERLEQLARRLRHGGAEGISELIAGPDRFEAVVAATIAGYFAGLHEREE